MRPRYLDTLARQRGVATFSQLMDGGLSRHQIQSLLRNQRLQRLSRSVLRDTTHDFSPYLVMWAATLIYTGVIDRHWALFLLGLVPEPQPPVTVTIGRDQRGRFATAVPISCRRRDLRPRDRATVGGIPATSATMTLFDTLCGTDRRAAAILDRALQLRLTTTSALRECLDHYRGAPGTPRAAALIAIADGDSESEAERLFLAVLAAAGITGFVQQVAFGRWRLDFAHAAAQVCVEIDGWSWHRQLSRKRADDAKQNALASAGWVTLRFGWHDLTDDPDRVRQTVVACLEERLSA